MKSKYSSDVYPTVSCVERGDTSKDISKMDSQGKGPSAGPSASSEANKVDVNFIDRALNRTTITQNR